MSQIDPALMGKYIYEWFSQYNTIDLQFQRFVGLDIPKYQTTDAAGCDLHAYQATKLIGGTTTSVPTELRLAIPKGHFGLIKERSSIARQGLFVVGGVIDCDYRGPMDVVLFNTKPFDVQFEAGQRIANLIFIPYRRANFVPVHYLPETERGEAGFGSTGK